MGLFGRARRGASVEYGWIRGDGLRYLLDKMAEAETRDGFVFVLIVGGRGKGKSRLALNLAARVVGEENVLDALVFTIDDFDSKVNEPPKGLVAEDGRLRLLLWDDIGLHFSTYTWFTPHMRQRMQEFIENFQTVREDVAILIGTAVEVEILPPKLRSAANIIIDAQRRGRAKVFGYTRYLWFRKWKVVGEIEWGPAEPSLYEKYREMKRRAHRAKQRSRLLARTKLARAYLDVIHALMQNGGLDMETLYGLGIIDIRGRLTDFGKYVISRDKNVETYVKLLLEKENIA
jgi:hypothetical protein